MRGHWHSGHFFLHSFITQLFAFEIKIHLFWLSYTYRTTSSFRYIK